jgi:hypothetical protein
MLKNFFSKLKAALSGGFQNIYRAIVPIVQSNAGQLIDKLLPVALGIVADLAQNHTMPSPGTSGTKQ